MAMATVRAAGAHRRRHGLTPIGGRQLARPGGQLCGRSGVAGSAGERPGMIMIVITATIATIAVPM
jgi:hypothetical protein